MENKKAKTHEDLEVYQNAFDAAMKIFELSKRFPLQHHQQTTSYPITPCL